MNASMDPGVSGDLNRTGWLEVVAAKVFGVKRPSCRIRNRNENPQVRRSKWSFGPVTLYNRTVVPPPLPIRRNFESKGGKGGEGSFANLLFASIGSRDFSSDRVDSHRSVALVSIYICIFLLFSTIIIKDFCSLIIFLTAFHTDLWSNRIKGSISISIMFIDTKQGNI